MGKRKILILGGTRFCGRELARILIEHGHSVTISSRRREGAPEGAEFIRGERENSLRKIENGHFSFDVVFDFTAYNAPSVIQALKVVPHSAYFLISTTWVKRNTLDEEISELTRQYINGKIAAETIAFDSHRASQKSCVIRFPILIGKNDHTGRIDFYLSRIRDNQGLILIDGGQNQVPLASSSDVAHALAKLVLVVGDRTIPALLEAQIEDAISLRSLVLRLFELEKVEPKTKNVPNGIMRTRFREYLKGEPFYLEKSLHHEGTNLFEFVSVVPRLILLHLEDSVSKEIKPLDLGLRARECQFMSTFVDP